MLSRPSSSRAVSAPPARSYAPGTHPMFDRPAAPASRTADIPSTPASRTVDTPTGPSRGTVYGGPAAHSPIEMTMPVSMNALENSGSLTGHILAQGWDHGADTGRHGNLKVVIAMLVVLVFLVGISLLFLATAGDDFSTWIQGLFRG
jgi:hypothetical protein